ncbi:MAG: M48 family metallopeptidase [bacterium]|nr:M48 family metallopeptidase [bacterium]
MTLLLAAGLAALAVATAVLIGSLLTPPTTAEALHHFSPEFLARAWSYQRTRQLLFLARFAMLAVLLTWVALFFLRRPAGPVSLAGAFLQVTLLLAVVGLLLLPLDLYRGFFLERAHGLAVHSAGAWLGDHAKSAAISIGLSAVGLTGLYWLMLRFPGRWWIPAASAYAAFLILAAYLSPLLVDPLFHRFTPLADEALGTEIIDMSRRAGVDVGTVLVADASRKTQKVNAYFTGLSGSRRIVLYDTLLSGFDRDEVLAVVAHEIGHWRHLHVPRGLAMAVAGTFGALFLLKVIFAGIGLASDFRALPVALLFVTLVSFATLPLQNTVSRVFEREADRDAVRLTGKAEVVTTLHKNLATANLSLVDPHPLLKIVLYSHPPAVERIRLATEEGERIRR